MTGTGAAATAERVARSDWLDGAVRGGLVAYGVVHLLIAWLAFKLALGDRHEQASNQGALRQLAEQPFGRALVWAVAIGMVFLVLWRLLEGARGHQDADEDERRWLRVGSLGKAVVYGALAVSAFKVAVGSGGSGGGRSTTARLMDLPAGPWIVGAVGLAILGYGLNQVRRGFTEKYREHLTAEGRSGDAGTAYLLLGKVGYVAKGASIGVVGILFCYAATSHDPKRSGGLDDALRTVLEQPFGPYLLGAMALGLGSYGLFCFARARHLST